MKAILDSIQPVIKNSKHVFIRKEGVANFAKSITEEDFKLLELQKDFLLKDASEGEQVALVIVYEAINFCYWGEPKWTVEIDGKFYDGGIALVKALVKGVKDGYPLLKAEYLASLSEKDLRKILSGNVEIPLFKERLKNLRRLGKVLVKKFNSSFMAVVKKGEYDAVKIVEVLVNDFPEVFNDEIDFHGNKVRFYKRAQLIPAGFYDLIQQGLVSFKLKSYEELTAFADYKVPQLMRKFGILEYSKDLAEKIDNKVEIPAGNDEEIGIRAATIWGIELASRILRKKFPQAVPARIDNILWCKGQVKSPDDKPYHRTKTVWY